jgi:hypothetical protein
VQRSSFYLAFEIAVIIELVGKLEMVVVRLVLNEIRRYRRLRGGTPPGRRFVRYFYDNFTTPYRKLRQSARIGCAWWFPNP